MYFLTPAELAAKTAADPTFVENVGFKIGAKVVPGSVRRDDAHRTIDFKVSDGVKTYPVTYHGLVPDTFTDANDIEVVVEGRLGRDGGRRGRAAAHQHVVVRDLDPADLRAGRTVELPRAQGVKHRRLRPAPPRIHVQAKPLSYPGWWESSVASALQRPPVLERLVPVDRRIAAAELELAARVPDLEPEEARAVPPLLGAQAAPVGVRDVGEAAVRSIQRTTSARGSKPPGGATGSALDAEGQHVHVLVLPDDRVQLGGRDHEEPLWWTPRRSAPSGR